MLGSAVGRSTTNSVRRAGNTCSLISTGRPWVSVVIRSQRSTGLAAGTSTLGFAAYTVICFWQFRNVPFRFDPVGTPFSIGDVIGAMKGGAESSVLFEDLKAHRIGDIPKTRRADAVARDCRFVFGSQSPDCAARG